MNESTFWIMLSWYAGSFFIQHRHIRRSVRLWLHPRWRNQLPYFYQTHLCRILQAALFCVGSRTRTIDSKLYLPSCLACSFSILAMILSDILLIAGKKLTRVVVGKNLCSTEKNIIFHFYEKYPEKNMSLLILPCSY